MVKDYLMVKGYLYDGESSASHTATLENNNGIGLTLIVDNTSHIIPWDDIHVSTRLGNSARYIKLASLGRFETLDNDGVDQLIKNNTHYQRGHLLYTMETRYHLVAVALLVTISFAFSFVKWGIPIIADSIAYSLPDNTTTFLENKAFAEFDKNFFHPSELSQEQQTHIRGLFADVEEKFDAQSKKYQLHIRKGNERIGANAFAFPSGAIVITDQLLQLANNDIQIAGVIAHELGHLEEKHSMRQIIRGSMLTIMVAWFSGDVSGTLSSLVTAPIGLLRLRYSREFETEADAYSIRYFDCDFSKLAEMAAFFGKLDGRYADNHLAHQHHNQKIRTYNEALSTHPAIEKRMHMLTTPHNYVDCY